MLTTTRTAVILATSGCLLAGARADEDEDIMLDAEASDRVLPNNDVALVALFTVGPILLLATCVHRYHWKDAHALCVVFADYLRFVLTAARASVLGDDSRDESEPAPPTAATGKPAAPACDVREWLEAAASTAADPPSKNAVDDVGGDGSSDECEVAELLTPREPCASSPLNDESPADFKDAVDAAAEQSAEPTPPDAVSSVLTTVVEEDGEQTEFEADAEQQLRVAAGCEPCTSSPLNDESPTDFKDAIGSPPPAAEPEQQPSDKGSGYGTVAAVWKTCTELFSPRSPLQPLQPNAALVTSTQTAPCSSSTVHLNDKSPADFEDAVGPAEPDSSQQGAVDAAAEQSAEPAPPDTVSSVLTTLVEEDGEQTKFEAGAEQQLRVAAGCEPPTLAVPPADATGLRKRSKATLGCVMMSRPRQD